MKYVWVVVILVLTLFTAVGDSALKNAGRLKQTNYLMLFVGLAVYLCTALVWFFIYKNLKFSSAGAIYGVTTVLVFTLIGVFYFRESLSLIEYVGIGSAVLSILLLGRFG